MAEEERRTSFSDDLSRAGFEALTKKDAPFMKDKEAYVNLYAYVQIFRKVVRDLGTENADTIHKYMLEHSDELNLPEAIASRAELDDMLQYAMQYSPEKGTFPEPKNIIYAYNQYSIDMRAKHREAKSKKEDAEKDIGKSKDEEKEQHGKEAKYALLMNLPVLTGLAFVGLVGGAVFAMASGAIAGIAAVSATGAAITLGGTLGTVFGLRGITKWFKSLNEKRKEARKKRFEEKKKQKELAKELKKKLIPALEKAEGKIEKDASVEFVDLFTEESARTASPVVERTSTPTSTAESSGHRVFEAPATSETVSSILPEATYEEAIPETVLPEAAPAPVVEPITPAAIAMNSMDDYLKIEPTNTEEVVQFISSVASEIKKVEESGTEEEKAALAEKKKQLGVKLGEIAFTYNPEVPSGENWEERCAQVEGAIKTYFEGLSEDEKKSIIESVEERDLKAKKENENSGEPYVYYADRLRKVAGLAPAAEAVVVEAPEIEAEVLEDSEAEMSTLEDDASVEVEILDDSAPEMPNPVSESEEVVTPVPEVAAEEKVDLDQIRSSLQAEQAEIMAEMELATQILDPAEKQPLISEIDKRIDALKKKYDETLKKCEGKEAQVIDRDFDDYWEAYNVSRKKLDESLNLSPEEKSAVALIDRMDGKPDVFKQECSQLLDRMKKGEITTLDEYIRAKSVLQIARDELNRKMSTLTERADGGVEVQSTSELDEINDTWSAFEIEYEALRRAIGAEERERNERESEEQAETQPENNEPVISDDKKPETKKSEQSSEDFAEDVVDVSVELARTKKAHGKTLSELAEETVTVGGKTFTKVEYYAACAEAYNQTHEMNGAAKESAYAKIMKEILGIEGVEREPYYVTGNNGKRRRTEFGNFLNAIREVESSRIDRESERVLDPAEKAKEKHERVGAFAARLREGIAATKEHPEISAVDFVDYVAEIGEESKKKKADALKKKNEAESGDERVS